ncbi:uncharacterized protein LOC125662600 isoform X2 [Ostrea edulis]|uniref:uncharacterized protein LOC125662600 isoform X2 n=1 Tax=Ostrea edulis TaxID=37623 RepID=UPI0024AEFE27|nr:uncharacterized protein LOC125662600 isoform X2 [Ostrea edulis]
MSVCQQRLLARMSTEKESLQTRHQTAAGSQSAGQPPVEPQYPPSFNPPPQATYQQPQTQPQHAYPQIPPPYPPQQYPPMTSQSPPMAYAGYNTNPPAIFVPPTKPEKSILEAYLLFVLLGFIGAHHFYLRRPLWGVLYFFTFGLLGCGWLIDLFRLPLLVSRCNKEASRPEKVNTNRKHVDDAYTLWLPGGFLGLHHFYLNNIGLGVLYMFTFGLLGVGWLIDLFLIPYHVKKANSRNPFSTEKSTATAFILTASPTGFIGAQHYYLNRIGFGLVYTFTFGIFGIGYIIDWCRVPVLIKRYNQSKEIGFIPRRYLDDAYLLWFPLGFLGFHHFYLNRPGWGFLYFFTFGLFGIGWLIDGCRLFKLVEDCNQEMKEQTLLRRNNQGVHNPNFVPGYQGGVAWMPEAGGQARGQYVQTNPQGYTTPFPGMTLARNSGYGATSGNIEPPPYDAGPLPPKAK